MASLLSIKKYSEEEAAALLGKSVAFLRKERAAKRISFTRIGRTPVYLERHLINYLEDNEETCTEKQDSKLENIGYLKKQAEPLITPQSTTPKQDKLSAHRSALAILKKPKNA